MKSNTAIRMAPKPKSPAGPASRFNATTTHFTHHYMMR